MQTELDEVLELSGVMMKTLARWILEDEIEPPLNLLQCLVIGRAEILKSSLSNHATHGEIRSNAVPRRRAILCNSVKSAGCCLEIAMIEVGCRNLVGAVSPEQRVGI